MVMKIKLPANERLQYLAGQYIDFQLKGGKSRSYSLANPPHDDALLELHIRHVPGGLFSDQVFSTLKERDILRLKGPLGSFFIRDDSDKPIIFIAGGTGFAPIKGMLEHAFSEHTDRELVLYWGVRSLKDLYMAELPQQWLAEHPNFSFIPVLSRPEPGDRWQGRIGFVHEAVLADFADLSGYQVYACGAPVMVDSARDSFVKTRKLPEDEFFADAFVYAADTETEPAV
jgi:CDP-4-dehydro-6-deoxyglucose reductase